MDLKRAIWSKHLIYSFFITIILFPADLFAGFKVSGTQLLDGNGQPFIIRGINHPYTWFKDKIHSFADIAATGANSIRVVLSDGQVWTRNSPSEVANAINLCKENKLVCILEVHDVTGSGQKIGAGKLKLAVQYWLDIKDVLIGEEDFVIINIANEPFGNLTFPFQWINEHRAAITSLREGGLDHTLLVDAHNWGQDWSKTMLNNATRVAEADSLHNTFFSVHMYEQYNSYSKVENYISSFLNKNNLPLIVGEFGADHMGNDVDEESIFAVTESYNIGYLGWSWSGNGSCCESLDIVDNFDPSRLSLWGNRLIYGANGIQQSSKPASVYLNR